MVINADDPVVLEVARRGRARQVRFAVTSAIDEGVTVSGDSVAYRSSQGDQPLVPLSAIRLPGRHLLSDVLAASAAGWAAGISADAMTRAVATFDGVEHTLELAGEVGGVTFVNDSKATNVLAAKAAIECFDRALVVILGGRFKGGNLADLEAPLSSRGAAVVAIGEARDQIRATLGASVVIQGAASMREAVRKAFALAPAGGTVLLAPACASLDMFDDYAERGRVFKKEVASLAQNAPAR